MVRRALPSLFLSTLLFVAHPALAQPDSGTVFFGAGALASIERLPRTSNLGIATDERDGTVAGGVLALGVYLTPHVSARVEWSLTDQLEFGTEVTEFPVQTPNVGPNLPTRLVIGPRIQGRRQAKVGAALLGYHVGSGRHALELLGGVGWVADETRVRYDFRIAGPMVPGVQLSLPFPSSESRSTVYYTVAMAGADVKVGLTEHVAIVPNIRLFGASGGLSIRPGVGVRWTF